MSLNFEFGRRVRRVRENDLGITRQRLAELLGIEPSRLEMIELGQMDEFDLTDEELKRFPDVLHRPLCWLLHGEVGSHRPRCRLGEPAEATRPARIIAQRSDRRHIQQELSLDLEECPRCKHPFGSGTRCKNCGHPLEF